MVFGLEFFGQNWIFWIELDFWIGRDRLRFLDWLGYYGLNIFGLNWIFGYLDLLDWEFWIELDFFCNGLDFFDWNF